MSQNVVHVVGTGTIGEPIVGLLAKNRQALGIDEVTFYKHSPRKEDRPMVRALQATGAKLAVADDKRAEFEAIGLKPDLTQTDALARARVVIDCTPEDSGLANKEKIYSKLAGDKLFMAQGSEEGFGAMYALGINDAAVDPAKKLLKDDRYVGLTDKAATNLVFSFAREHGPFGRILSQTVVVTPSLHVSENGLDITGYAFTPQDGNALLSSVAMATRKLHPEDWQKRMSVFDAYLLKEY